MSHKNKLALLGLVLGAAPAATVEAQGFQLDQFRAAETADDGFALSRPERSRTPPTWARSSRSTTRSTRSCTRTTAAVTRRSERYRDRRAPARAHT
jgi:hypothetical protein